MSAGPPAPHGARDGDAATRLDARQQELLRELATLRGEDEGGLATTNGKGGGLFSRLRSHRR